MRLSSLCFLLLFGAGDAASDVEDAEPQQLTPPAQAPEAPTPMPTGGGFRIELHPKTRKYRLWITKNYGDDHFCIGKLLFFDQHGNALNASLVSMSSCYGCTSCDNCTSEHGQPEVLFENNTDAEEDWACSQPGTFTKGMGQQSIEFMLDQRPMSYTLHMPEVNGEWVAKDFSLEESAGDNKWMVVDTAENMSRQPNQHRNISMGGVPVINVDRPLFPPWYYEYPEAWVYNYPKCGGKMQSPINLTKMAEMGSSSIFSEKLTYDYKPLNGRALANFGSGLQVAGDFGTLTLPTGVYRASQFHFHFPAEHIVLGVEKAAIGEMHIIHQKEGSNFTDDIAVVSIMLHLPLEEDVLKSQEKWFLALGLLDIPEKFKYSMPLETPVDLTFFDKILQGRFWHYTGSLDSPPCTEGVQWFVMEKFAYVPGVIVNQFKERFPDPANARPVQKLNNRPVYVSKLPTASTSR
jgi:carbonic anhydrase